MELRYCCELIIPKPDGRSCVDQFDWTLEDHHTFRIAHMGVISDLFKCILTVELIVLTVCLYRVHMLNYRFLQ